MKRALWIFPWMILLIPFFVLSLFYGSISQEILIYRSFGFGGSETYYAPKSLFTVFRVPLIEAVFAAMIVIMRRKTSELNSEFRLDYYSMWSVLLFTVALKSLFQTFEFVLTSIFSQPHYASVFFYTTLTVVGGGIFLALVKGKKIFTNFQSQSWKLKNWEKISFTIFFLIYLSLAFVPMLIYK